MEHKIIQTGDGSKTLYLPHMDEPYHSVNGAITESDYVFIKTGYLFNKSKNPVVFEAGFGTGLNALLTAIHAERNERPTVYYSIEKFPLENQIIQQLDYDLIVPQESRSLFEKIHTCEWGKMVRVSEYFYMQKIHSDLIENNLSELKHFDIIYFDAFGPDKQPEVWTPEIFNKIYIRSSAGAVFVTYSAKGEIRRRLERAGFTMERLPGPPGKKQMLRGIKII